MPPWIIPEFAPDEPAAKSFFSTSMADSPRIAASRAMTVPFTPPPMTSRSYAVTAIDPDRVCRAGATVPARRGTLENSLSSLRLASGRSYVQLPKLVRIDLVGRVCHEGGAFLRLRERDHIPQALRPGEQHRQPVHAEGDSAVWRGPEPQRLQEEAELVLGLLVADAHRGEDLLLHDGIVQPDRSPADLESVQDEIVAVAEDASWIGFQILDVLVVGPGEGVMGGDEPLEILVVLEERRVDDPEESPGGGALRIARAVLGNEAEPLPQVQAEVRENGVDAGLLPELEEDQVACLRPHRGVDRRARVLRDALREGALGPVPLLVDLGAGEPLRAHALRDLL